MCYSNCPYERWSGECGGKSRLNKGQPHCFEDEDVEAHNESCDDDAILNYELDRADAQDHNDNRREEDRIFNH